MTLPSIPRRVMVFVDGENFLQGIRTLFRGEFDRRDYLPRTARWDWFFGKIAEELHAVEFSVRWYVINELDFHPRADWEREPWDVLLRKIGVDAIRKELMGKRTEQERRSVVEQHCRLCQESEMLMRQRLAEWHALQASISMEHPFVQFFRPGWQPCSLPDRNLGKEKAIDIGLAVDLLRKANDYDLAVLFSGDGDYVPAVKVIQAAGKQVALMEFALRNGEILRGTSWRLNELADITISVPYEDLTKFLGLEQAR